MLASPGDVVLSGWGCMKVRPWVVLWLDDEARLAACAAITSQTKYAGAVDTGDPEWPTVAAWVMVQPYKYVKMGRVIGHLDGYEALGAKLRAALALTEACEVGT